MPEEVTVSSITKYYQVSQEIGKDNKKIRANGHSFCNRNIFILSYHFNHLVNPLIFF